VTPPPTTTTHDLTELARPVVAASPHLDEVIGGHHHEDRFFFADEQVSDIAAAVTGRTLARGGTGWPLRGDRPSRLLRRAWINGEMHSSSPTTGMGTIRRAAAAQHRRPPLRTIESTGCRRPVSGASCGPAR
jgi:hypothetical protein